MIQIRTFFPMDNLSRGIWEFHDEKIVAKTRSLIADREDEISYVSIRFIKNKRVADLYLVSTVFLITAIIAGVRLTLNYFRLSNSTTQIIEQTIMLLALVLIPFAFRKHEYFSFLDVDKDHLATIRTSKKNRTAMLEAIERIKQKTEIIDETYLNDPLPSARPVYEFVEFVFPGFLYRSTARFYEDRIIDSDKSLVEEEITITRYSELSGETKTARTGNERWDSLWSYWLTFLCIASVSMAILFPQQVAGNLLIQRLFFGGVAMIIPMFFLKYIKSEYLFLYNKKGNVAFWTSINSKNREKVKQMVEFVQEKISRKDGNAA